MSFMDLRALKRFYSRPTFFDEPIKCAECRNPIYLSKTEIKKKRCLYLTSDTDEWKNKNGK